VTLRHDSPEATAVTYRVELVKARRRRDAVLATELVTLPAGAGIVRARFDLSRLTDSDGLSLVRRGRYFVRATAVTPPGPAVDSPDVHVRLLTAKRLESDYLHGLGRLSADFLQARHALRAITGVEIVEVEQGTTPAFHVLAFDRDPSGTCSLRWAGGPAIALDPRHRRFVLPDTRDGWIDVAVDGLDLLPPASVQEPVLIERGRIGSDVLGRFVDRASDWLEATALQVYVEPTLLSTDGESLPALESDTPAPGVRLDHDVRVPPLSLYPPTTNKWTGIRFPYAHVTKVLGLVGQLAGAPVLRLPHSWIQLQEKIGFAQLVPSREPAAQQLFGFLAGDALHGAIELPGFWHFALRAGLREVPGDVVEAIAKKAALDALTAIGQSFKPGVASESFSKDLSVSTSYVRNAQANLLSASRAEYKADLDALLPRLRNRYLGLSNVAIV